MTDPAQQMQGIVTATDTTPGRRESWLVFAALTLIYIVAVAAGNHRYVWFDELFTFNIAKSPSLQQLWQREITFDCNPPGVYLFSRVSMSILGANKLGLRFPSMVEFYLGSMMVLLYVRRKAGLAFAALAVLFLWTAEPTLYYAVEARPYALIVMGFAGLLVSWDTAVRTQPRRLALLGMAISTFLLCEAHMFTALTLLAFVVAEIVRSIRQRKADIPLLAALLLPMIGVIVYLPLLHSCGGIIFPIHASYNTLFVFFKDTLSSPIITAAVLLTLVLPATKERPSTSLRFQPEEIALFVCLILLSPALLTGYMAHRQGFFFDRYCMTSQIAILIAFAMLLQFRLRPSRRVAYAACILIACYLFKMEVWHAWRFPQPANAAFLASIDPDLPLVVGEGQVFLEMNQYESAPLLNRLYFLKDQQASMQYVHTNIFQDFAAPDLLRQAGFPFPANIESYSGFVRQHHQFLYLGNTTHWVFAKLLASGATIAYVGDYGGSMPYSETTLFLVSLPGSN